MATATEKIDALTKEVERLTKAADKKIFTPAGKNAAAVTEAITRDHGGNAAATQTGPFTSSKGFSLCKAIAYVSGLLTADQVREEREACQQFRKALEQSDFFPRSREPDGMRPIWLPLGHELLPEKVTAEKEYKVFKSMWAAGASGVDLGEIEWMARHGSPTVKKTAMSYLQDTIGGTLVAPPVQGELIELIRPRECLMQAGATSVPLPPNGRITWPRQTGPTSFYFVGENTSITESNPTTGQISMQAKKGGVFVTVPNELLLYASPAADAMIRKDASKSIALGIDYSGLYGTGGAAQPKGLVNFTGTNELIQYQSVTPAPKGIGTNGNRLRPEDGYRMMGLLEDRNFEFSGWIFRPSLARNIGGYRADAAAPDDAAGQFVQSMMRQFQERIPTDSWVGERVTKSAIVRGSLTKGSGTGLTEVFGGQWEHLMVGMYGGVELAMSNQTANTFQQDQTAIRALVHFDICPRYEGAFVWYPYLLNSTN